jgi:uncharacterized membrane protein YgcG
MDDDITLLWPCRACTYHNVDSAATCAMCGTVKETILPAYEIPSSSTSSSSASAVPFAEESEDREIRLALSTTHCSHCLGVVGTNCSCGLQCAKGVNAKCVGDPVMDAIRRREREREEEIQRLEIERQEKAAEAQRALEASTSSCNMCSAKLKPGFWGVCNQCNKLGCPRLHEEGGPQGALVQERFMQQQSEHSARVHAQWAAQGIMSSSDASLSSSAASLASGRGWNSGGSGSGSGGSGGGGGRAVLVPFIGGPMDTATFRRRMEAAGTPLLPGQDVCHIIAKSKGGADHSDNFFVAGSSFNRSTGNRSDHIIAYLAGLPKTELAVAVSRSTGYTGPSASVLVQLGKDQFASLRRST